MLLGTVGNSSTFYRAYIKITYNFILNGECFPPVIQKENRMSIHTSIQYGMRSYSQGNVNASGLEGGRDEQVEHRRFSGEWNSVGCCNVMVDAYHYIFVKTLEGTSTSIVVNIPIDARCQ